MSCCLTPLVRPANRRNLEKHHPDLKTTLLDKNLEYNSNRPSWLPLRTPTSLCRSDSWPSQRLSNVCIRRRRQLGPSWHGSFTDLDSPLLVGWFIGHLVLILTTTRYFLSWIWMNYYSRMAQFSYRTSFIAAAVTYGIVVYKTQRARAKTGNRAPNGAIGLLSDENVQYLRT